MIILTSLILASGSPRRKELLENLQLSFSCIPSQIDEAFESGTFPAEIVKQLAYSKASDIRSRHNTACVIGADTIVVFGDTILGKPETTKDAFQTLKMLSGHTHYVYTGVAILYQENEVVFYEKTEVTFWELTDEEIHDYIASDEPMDKAGSYGIQALGATLVKKINGDYFTVVGLPISRMVRELKKLGVI